MKSLDNIFEQSFSSNRALDRAFILLEGGEFEKADNLFESILTDDPRNAEAYLGKFLVAQKATDISVLITATEEQLANVDYQRMLRFADDDIKALLDEVESEKAKIETEKKYGGIYNSLIERYNKASTEEEYRAVAEELGKLNGYKLSGKIEEVAKERAETFRKNKGYEKASTLSQSKKPDDLIEAGKIYADL